MLFEVDGLSYRYDDGTEALLDVSFELEEGDHTVVLGSNGSGKSTLLRLLDGLLFPAGGAIRFRGRELSERALADPAFRTEFRQNVGFVFQNADAQLFNATVFEELAFGPHQLGLDSQEVDRRVRDVLGFLGIAHLAERPPFRMSGGEKRKVAIASVLTMNPAVLLFDEPFLGLDPRSQKWLVETLRRLQAAGKTTVVATHTMGMVEQIADRMVVLSEEHRVVTDICVEVGINDHALLQAANLI